MIFGHPDIYRDSPSQRHVPIKHRVKPGASASSPFQGFLKTCFGGTDQARQS